MNLEVKDMLVLEDDITYIVAANAILEKIEYFFFIDKDNYQNYKIGFLDNEAIAIVKDAELIKKLMPKFGRSAIKILKEFMDGKK